MLPPQLMIQGHCTIGLYFQRDFRSCLFLFELIRSATLIYAAEPLCLAKESDCLLVWEVASQFQASRLPLPRKRGGARGGPP